MVQSGAEEVPYEFRVADRGDVARKHLALGPPDSALRLSDDATIELSEWSARRYTRTAFPDAFVDRLRGKPRERLRNLQRKYPSDVRGVYVRLSTFDELAVSTPYRVQLQVVIAEEAWDDLDRRTEIEKQFFEPVVAAFGSAPGIVVTPNGCQMTATHLFPISELEVFVPLDTDLDFSYAEDPPAEIPIRSARGR